MSSEHLTNDIDVLDKYNSYILEACSLYSINPQEITPMQWEFCLRYTGRKVFEDRSILFSEPYDPKNDNGRVPITNNNAYNIDTLYNIYIEYVELCNIYNKVNFIKNYLALVGIHFETFEKFKLLQDSRQGQEISGAEFVKRVQKDCESSLVDHLMQDKTNPLKAQTVLNNRYGWSTGRTISEQAPERIAPSSRDDLLVEFAHNQIESQDIVDE